jgi:hypothetical protein
MKNFLLTVGFVAGVFFLARFAAEKKAEAMVDVASAMGRDGRYEEALKQLDDVQSWFSWTKAAQRIEGERQTIRRKTQAIEAQGEFERRIADSDRERRADAARADAADRQLELARIQAAAQQKAIADRDRDRADRERNRN